MRVIIGGTPGSGKSVVAKAIAKRLKLKHYSMGDLIRKLAIEKGMNLAKFNKLRVEDSKFDRMIDEFQAKLGRKEDDFVIDGRLSFHFIPKSFKIFLDVKKGVGAERIFKDKKRKGEKKYKNVEEALEAVKSRIRNDKKLYKKIYNINYLDKKSFDHVIDTTNLTINEVVEEVVKFLHKKIRRRRRRR